MKLSNMSTLINMFTTFCKQLLETFVVRPQQLGDDQIAVLSVTNSDALWKLNSYTKGQTSLHSVPTAIFSFPDCEYFPAYFRD